MRRRFVVVCKICRTHNVRKEAFCHAYTYRVYLLCSNKCACVPVSPERCCENRPLPNPRSRQSPGTFEVMRSIVESRGVGGLYTGALPRVAKVAPACAIMIFSYEAGKRFFAERNARLAAENAAQRQ